MSDQERRVNPRRPLQAEIGLMTAEGSLEGTTINISRNGALIRAKGSIAIQVIYEGKEYRGHLVRATPIDSGTMAYAIQLDEPIQ